MKKLLALVLALLVAGSCLALTADGAKAAAPTVTLTEPTATSARTPDAVRWFEASDGTWIFFLPSAFTAKSLRLWYSGSDVLEVNGAKVASGDTCYLGESGKITAGKNTYPYRVMQSIGVATVFVTTQSGSMTAIDSDPDHVYAESGQLKIFDANGKSQYDGALSSIKGRGNASWKEVKKGYNLKLDKKTDLLGMGKSKKWCLIANHTDKSLLCNAVMFGAAKEIGLGYSPLCRPCDVYFNGEYNGSYLLTTKIEADSKRVDIHNLDDDNEEITQAATGDPDFEMDALPQRGVYGRYAGLLENTRKWVDVPAAPAGTAEPDVTGGYLIEMEIANRYQDELSGFVTSRSQPYILKCPEYASEAQINYIADYVQRLEDAVFDDGGVNAQGESYRDLADFDSLVNYYLLSEWGSNMDSGLTSTYFYKDAGGKLYAGPVWDYDNALGNNPDKRYGCDYTNPEEFTVCFGRQYRNTVFGTTDAMSKPTLYNQLCQKQEFVNASRANWDRNVGAVLQSWSTDKLDAYAATVERSAAMNAVRWNLFDTADPAAALAAYRQEVANVRDFAVRRTAFLNANLGTVQTQSGRVSLIARMRFAILPMINDMFERMIVMLHLENS